MNIAIRTLTASDAPAYTALRREMLADSPWAFAASPESDRALRPGFFDDLSQPGQALLGAFDTSADPPALVASAGVYRLHHPKMAHRAHIWGVYTTPGARGRGIGERVVAAAVEAARAWPGVTSVGLSASANSAAAIRVYERLGFVTWGVEPAAVIIDGRAYDEVHMVLFFDRR